MNVECYRRAVKMTMHPDKRVPVGRKIKNGKRLYTAKYGDELGTTNRQQHEEIGRAFRAARMAGVPESDCPPISYCTTRRLGGPDGSPGSSVVVSLYHTTCGVSGATMWV